MSDEFDQRRKELFELNSKAWEGIKVFETKTLDTSLKKNTAYIKKIRTSITKESEKYLIDGVATVSLEKYIHELLSATSEGLCKTIKNQDIQSSIEVISALHQRFNLDFTPYLMLYFTHAMANPPKSEGYKDPNVDKDEKERLSRQRILLRLFMEFYLSGIFRSTADMPKQELPGYLTRSVSNNPGEPLIISVLKEVLMFEINKGGSASLATSFLKRFSIYTLSENEFLLESTRLSLKDLFVKYTAKLVNNSELYDQQIRKHKEKSRVISMKTGKIVEGIEEEIEVMKTRFEKCNNYCEFACELLSVDKPDLTKVVEEESSGNKVTVVNNSGAGNGGNAENLLYWETDEAKKFYEDYLDLEQCTIPKELLVDHSKKDKDKDKDAAAAIVSSSNSGSKMMELLARLDECETGKDVDTIAIEFWMSKLNNKSSRQRIYKHFMESHEITKLRNFARFLKINENYFNSLKNELIEYLDKGFRSQIHQNKIDFKNIHFFAELVKFKLVPIYVLFHKIRSLILNIEVVNNIDILSLLFEDCGKLLMNYPEYKEHTEEMIQLLKSLTNKNTIKSNDRQTVDIFLLSINPPSIKLLNEKIKALTMEEKFINQLVRKELNSKNWTIVSNLLEKLNWKDEIVFKRLLKTFTRPDKVSYENIKYLAMILFKVSKHNKIMLIYVIDDLFEQFSIGLEKNNFKYNRIRMSQFKYFAELSNLGVIKTDMMMQLLYKTLCFGHKDNNPSRYNFSELDKPNDYFRVQLICLFFNSYNKEGLSKKSVINLDVFYRFFDYYIWNKCQPIPLDVDVKVRILFDGLEQSRSTSYEDSVATLQIALAEQGYKVEAATDEEGEDDDDDEDEEEDVDVEDEEEDEDELIGELQSGSESEADTSDSEDEDSDSDEDSDEESSSDSEYEDDSEEENDEENMNNEEIYQKRLNEQIEKDLEKEFAKMMAESYSNSSRSSTTLGSLASSSSASKLMLSDRKTKDKKTFTFLTKSGKKINSKEIVIPEDSKFTSSYVEENAKQQLEKQKINSFVLARVDRLDKA